MRHTAVSFTVQAALPLAAVIWSATQDNSSKGYHLTSRKLIILSYPLDNGKQQAKLDHDCQTRHSIRAFKKQNLSERRREIAVF